MDLSLKVFRGNVTFNHSTTCFQLHFLRQRRHVRQIHIFPAFRVKKLQQNLLIALMANFAAIMSSHCLQILVGFVTCSKI